MPSSSSAEEPARLNLWRWPQPPRRVKPMRALYPAEVFAGEEFEIVVRRAGKPVSGVTIAVGEPDEKPLSVKKSNAAGAVHFRAPRTKFALELHVDVHKAGFYHGYRTPSSLRSQMGAWSPYLAAILVRPFLLADTVDSAPLARKPQKKRRIELAKAYGWVIALLYLGPGYFSKLLDLFKKMGFDFDTDLWAGHDVILEQLKHKGGNDVWIFLGHTNSANNLVNGLVGWRPFSLSGLTGGKLITVDELKKAIGHDGGSPGIVFLGACESAQLLDACVEACAKVALGFTEKTAPNNVGWAIKTFWTAMLSGKTLGEATKEVQAKIPGFIYKVKSWLKPDDATKTVEDMTLDQILDATPPPP
jgi:hypothetical protein